MRRITSDEFKRTFWRHVKERLDAPLTITCDGEDRLVVLSLEEYARITRRGQYSIAIEDLSDLELEALRCVKAPAEAAKYNHEFPTHRDAES